MNTIDTTNTTKTYAVKTKRGYYSGHKCGGRASWRPKFKVKFTSDIGEATRFNEQQAMNLVTNLFLMNEGELIGAGGIVEVSAPVDLKSLREGDIIKIKSIKVKGIFDELDGIPLRIRAISFPYFYFDYCCQGKWHRETYSGSFHECKSVELVKDETLPKFDLSDVD